MLLFKVLAATCLFVCLFVCFSCCRAGLPLNHRIIKRIFSSAGRYLSFNFIFNSSMPFFYLLSSHYSPYIFSFFLYVLSLFILFVLSLCFSKYLRTLNLGNSLVCHERKLEEKIYCEYSYFSLIKVKKG
jgi:hypothetical protein